MLGSIEKTKLLWDPYQSTEATKSWFFPGLKGHTTVDETCSDSHRQMAPKMPETPPVSHDKLVMEVKGIYAGLMMVKAKCIDIDIKQSAAAMEKDAPKSPQIKNDQWQSLIALHKQLLHEHHDFFLASQHPAASPALSRLAAKYSMPARMWRHGIHAFLEDLRYRLPDSLEHMLAFIHIAYSMMALLCETVPTFEDTWIEYLGDLGRYRMAIEDDETRDRETRSNIARSWYNKAADKNPSVGRLYHHLAILARPYSLEQLSLYIRALPFERARGSVMTLFKPILQGTDTRANIRFLGTVHELEKDSSYDKYIVKSDSKFKEAGVYCADANIAALFEYGTPKQGRSKATLRLVYEDARRIREEVSKFEDDQNMKSQGVVNPESDSRTAVGLPNPDIEALVLSEDDSISSLLSARHTTGPQPSPLESAMNTANTATQDESSTEHQLTNTFAALPRSALDQTSYWTMRITSCRQALGYFRCSSVGAAYKIRSFVALTLPICTLFIVPTTARTIPRNASNEGSTASFSAAIIPLAHWPYLAFVIITLLVAQYLAHTKDPIFVWGCMMSVWAFGWWTIRADPSTTLPISVVVLSLWAISAYQYGHAAFSKHRIPMRAGVIIIISAMILDVSTVTLMTPSEASTAQPQLLLSLALPLVSLILAAMVNTVAAMQSAEQTHALEERPQVYFPYIQEQAIPGRRQRRLRTPVEAYFRPVELPTTPSESG